MRKIVLLFFLLSLMPVSSFSAKTNPIEFHVNQTHQNVSGEIYVNSRYVNTTSVMANSSVDFSDFSELKKAIIHPLVATEYSWRLEVISPDLNETSMYVPKPNAWVVELGIPNKVTDGSYEDYVVYSEVRGNLRYINMHTYPSPFTLLFYRIDSIRIELEFVTNTTPHRNAYNVFDNVTDIVSPDQISYTFTFGFMASNKTHTFDFYIKVIYIWNQTEGFFYSQRFRTIFIYVNASSVSLVNGWLILQFDDVFKYAPFLAWLKLNEMHLAITSNANVNFVLTSAYIYTKALRIVTLDPPQDSLDWNLIKFNGVTPQVIDNKLTVILDKVQLITKKILVNYYTSGSKPTPNFVPPTPKETDVGITFEITLIASYIRSFSTNKDITKIVSVTRKVVIDNISFTEKIKTALITIDDAVNIIGNETQVIFVNKTATKFVRIYATFPADVEIVVKSNYPISGDIYLYHTILKFAYHEKFHSSITVSNLDTGDYECILSAMSQTARKWISIYAGKTQIVIEFYLNTKNFFEDINRILTVIIPASIIAFSYITIRVGIDLLGSTKVSSEKIESKSISLWEYVGMHKIERAKTYAGIVFIFISMLIITALTTFYAELPDLQTLILIVMLCVVFVIFATLLFSIIFKVDLIDYKIEPPPKEAFNMIRALASASFLMLLYVFVNVPTAYNWSLVYIIFCLGAMYFISQKKTFGLSFSMEDIYAFFIILIASVPFLAIEKNFTQTIFISAEISKSLGVNLILCVCVVAPIIEELFFRATDLFDLLLMKSNGILASAIIAYVFALFHTRVYQGNLFAFYYLFVMGYAMALATLSRKNVTPAIMFHMLNNALAVIRLI